MQYLLFLCVVLSVLGLMQGDDNPPPTPGAGVSVGGQQLSVSVNPPPIVNSPGIQIPDANITDIANKTVTSALVRRPAASPEPVKGGDKKTAESSRPANDGAQKGPAAQDGCSTASSVRLPVTSYILTAVPLFTYLVQLYR